MYKHQTHPLALVSQTLPDPSVVQGAILAGIPIVCDLAPEDIAKITGGDIVEVDGSGTQRIHPERDATIELPGASARGGA